MDKETAENKRDFHRKRTEFYDQKVIEAESKQNRIGFKFGKKR